MILEQPGCWVKEQGWRTEDAGRWNSNDTSYIFKAILLLALFAIAMAEKIQPEKEAAPESDDTRVKRGGYGYGYGYPYNYGYHGYPYSYGYHGYPYNYGYHGYPYYHGISSYRYPYY